MYTHFLYADAYLQLPMSSQLSSTATRIIHLVDNCISTAHIHQIQAQIILRCLHPNTNIAHHFINACQYFGLLNSAFLLYSQLQRPHIFICNTLIKAFSHSHSPHRSISMYTHMHKNSILPNNYTFPFILKSVSDLKGLGTGELIHAQIVKLGHFNDIYVQNSLLNLYSSCGDMGLCEKVFDEMPLRDVVSWTVMITGYREAGMFDDALFAFEQMQYASVVPNRVTMVNALAACASYGALEMGVWIHDFIRRNGWELDVILGTSLIDMYGKCGNIEEGVRVFQSMKERNVFTWNAVIKGLALAKSGQEAVKWFFKMEHEGTKPDQVTLLGVLCACVHSGLVQTGERIFSLLSTRKYGFPPSVKHYACTVDLLARNGRLKDALDIIEGMPFKPTKSTWGALLAGSRVHADLELCELAAWKLVELAPENSAYYFLLSNLYADMGRWSDVERVRSLMKERGLEKDLGSSSIELEPQEHVFELLA